MCVCVCEYVFYLEKKGPHSLPFFEGTEPKEIKTSRHHIRGKRWSVCVRKPPVMFHARSKSEPVCVILFSSAILNGRSWGK